MNDKLIDFMEKFVNLGRTDVLGLFRQIKDKKTYRPQANPDDSISRDIIVRHLNGKQPIGIYMMIDEGVRLATIDIDNHDGDGNWEDMQTIVGKLSDILIEHGFNPFPVLSGGGRGIHLHIIFERAQVPRAVRRALRKILALAGLADGTTGLKAGTVELFPKQDALAEGQKGNLIACPFGRKSRPLDRATMQPVPLERWQPPLFEELFSPDIEEEEEDDHPTARQKHDASSRHYDAGPPLPGDLGEAESALKYIKSDDYHTWMRLGHALKFTFGEDGFAIWDRWSSASARYQGSEDCRRYWDGFKPTGQVRLGTVFFLAREGGWNGPSNAVIREMNARFGILTHGNRTMIILKNGDRRPDDENILLGLAPFEDRLAPETFTDRSDSSNPVKRAKAKFWLKHALAAHYHYLDFDPSLRPGHNAKMWNLWRGFAFDAIPGGSWDLLRAHILDNVCGGNLELFEWFISWLAWGVQNPGEVIGTSIVLLGPPGVGKSFIANQYGALWGIHYTTITQASHVIGRFNSHLSAKRFVFIDEGTFGGNRKEAGVIKTRVTEKYIMLEQKGIDPIRMRNRAMYMIASNEDSVVPADMGDRRWQVFEVGIKNRQDHEYFAAIQAQMDDGGYEAMLFDLLHRDIDAGPNPRKTIKTEALFEQILQAQPAYVQYLHRILDEGRLPQNWVAGARSTTIKAMHDELRRQYPEARFLSDNALGRRIRQFFPTVMFKLRGWYYPNPGYPKAIPERSTQYDFPPLKQARVMFERKVGQTIQWTYDLPDWISDEAPDGENGVEI